MDGILLSPEESEWLRPYLNVLLPADLPETLAREAAEKPDEREGEKSLALLTESRYMGVKVQDGVVYLGLPPDVTEIIRGMLGAYVKLHPGKRQLPPPDPSPLGNGAPIVYIAIPRRQ